MTRRVADLAIIAALAVYVMAAVALLCNHPWPLALLLAWPPVLLGSRLGNPRRALVFAATGLVLGPVTESVCISCGLWTYHETGGLPLVPAWNYPLWTCLPAALWIIVRSVLGKRASAHFHPLHLLLLLAGLATEIALFCLLGHSTPLVLATALPLGALVLLVSRRLETLVVLISGSLIGPLCESLAITRGAWHYALAEVLGMPLWLPLGYGLFAVFVALAAEQLGALVAGPSAASGSRVHPLAG